MDRRSVGAAVAVAVTVLATGCSTLRNASSTTRSSAASASSASPPIGMARPPAHGPSAPVSGVAPATGPFPVLAPGFTQALFGVAPSFFGGVAFAPNGDVLVDNCVFSGSPLLRFDHASTLPATNGTTTLHPYTTEQSAAGCGLTNHPNGAIYTNTSSGVIKLDANTGAQTGGPFGAAGNALGIAPDPQSSNLAYVLADRASIGFVNAALTTSGTLASNVGSWIDQITYDPSGNYIFASDDGQDALKVFRRDGTLVQSIALSVGSDPDGIAFHSTAPQFVVTNNNDGSLTRFDFPGSDFTKTPTQSVFASGGFRGDNTQVGSDGCLYLTQNGTRYADGTVTGDDSVVRICPGFQPPPGVGGQGALPILFLHGVDEAATDNVFASLFQHIKAAVPNASIQHFEYFQDKADSARSGCDTSKPGEQPVALPQNLAGMPVDTSQNSPPRCDSEGDLGQNAIRLDRAVSALFKSTGKKVVLIGYSMGGETIRAFLSYSTQVNDGVAAGMLDSVITMHGVEQGSWLSLGSAGAAGLPFGLHTVLGDLLHTFAPNPNRPATRQFSPTSSFMRWTDSRSTKLPTIPYYNTWGDERLDVQHCFLPFHHACVSSDVADWGDMVLLPGTDVPTQTPTTGGERFLPGPYAPNRWEWAEPYVVGWDPVGDPFAVGAIAALISAPGQHAHLPSQQANVTVFDCKNGQSVDEATELSRIIAGRITGSPYSCNVGVAP